MLLLQVRPGVEGEIDLGEVELRVIDNASRGVFKGETKVFHPGMIGGPGGGHREAGVGVSLGTVSVKVGEGTLMSVGSGVYVLVGVGVGSCPGTQQENERKARRRRGIIFVKLRMRTSI